MLKRTLRVLLVSFLAISILPAVPARAAGAGMRLTKTIGPPTTKTTVQGHGFGASEGVHIRFDSMPVGSATTDPSGAFRKTIAVPASALVAAAIALAHHLRRPPVPALDRDLWTGSTVSAPARLGLPRPAHRPIAALLAAHLAARPPPPAVV